jgi:predicted oxidoreductase
MDKIYLSDAGPKVSPAIYGFWRWEDDAEHSEAEMERIINLCLDLGINTFDHADYYAGYQAEKLFGNVMLKRSFKREDIVLFSKCGQQMPHASQPAIRVAHLNSSATHIRECVEQSLRNLKTDYLDIFLLDHLDHLSNLEETALALQQLKTSGKIKNIGVANFSVFQHQLLSACLRAPIVTNHIELNLLHTQAIENGQLDYIKQKYMRPLAAAPLADGLIENGTDAKAVRVRAKLVEVGAKYGINAETAAVAWLIKLGALPLVGTRKEQRIRNIAAACSIEMEHQDWYDLYNTSKD